MISDLLTCLSTFDWGTFWTAVIAVLTFSGVLVAWRQLAGIRATSRADFTFRFIESFFTAETRTLFTLLINSALTFDVKEITQDGKPIDRLPYLKINDAVVSQVTGIVSPLPNNTGYSALEVDDLLLGHFESLGWYVRNGLIDFDAAWSNFSDYLITSFEHPEIGKYLADPDCADGDTYSDFRYLYQRFHKHAQQVSQTTSSDDVTQTSAPLPDAKELLLKELDHIQAILARYDTFFFLMKQLCATAVFVSIVEFLKHQKPPAKLPMPFWTVAGIPLFFLATEYFFRLFHWSGYILRLGTLRDSINNRETPQCMYVIKDEINITKPGGLKRLREHAWKSVKAFDWLVFYPTLIVVVLLIRCCSGVR
jgi:hypothetical protein